MLYFFIDCFLLVVSLNHIPSLLNRSTFPFAVERKNGTLVIEKIADEDTLTVLRAGDMIAAVNDSIITMPEQLEFISDNSSIGSSHKIRTIKNGSAEYCLVATVPYYPNLLYIIVVYFVGITFLAVGFFVVWNRPADRIAHIFHWMMALIGTAIMITWGSLEAKTLTVLATRSLFFLTYVFGIASFYLFTKLYCTETPRFIALRITAVYLFSFIVSLVLIYYHLLAFSDQSLTAYAYFQRYFDLFHIALFIAFIAGSVNIIRAYRRTDSPEGKSRLEWILWGFFISSTPFLLLYILPQILFSRYLIAEEYTTIFFIALPFSFGVSFIKYHLFDIRLLIKRTIVNFIFSMIIAISYFIIVILAAAVINRSILSTEHFIIITLTLIIAMAVNPLRNKLQTFIDRILFKAHAGYTGILNDVSEKMKHTVSREEIFAVVLRSILTSLPVERCIVYHQEGGTLFPSAQSGDKENNAATILLNDRTPVISPRCTAIRDIVRSHHEQLITIDNDIRLKTGSELFIPIKSSRIPILGAVGISRIHSNDKFDHDEIALLLSICDYAAEHLERLELLESMFREKEERKRAEELSRLKSDFVSYVSHELQTPLTSIRMFSELLQRNIKAKKGKEHLQIIVGESERLSRMVNNLLDVSRIESGLKEYHFDLCSLNECIGSVTGTMAYMIEKHGCTLRYTSPRSPLTINADKDAVEQAVMNLISNAIKYSPKNKLIHITVSKKGNDAVCSVRDHGCGIPEKERASLFNRFYRLPEHRNTVKGIGLGLSVVKHIVDAHQGRIEVHSTVGKGTTFTLFFPLHQSTESL